MSVMFECSLCVIKENRQLLYVHYVNIQCVGCFFLTARRTSPTMVAVNIDQNTEIIPVTVSTDGTYFVYTICFKDMYIFILIIIL